MSTPFEPKESAIANDVRIPAALPHDCSNNNVGLMPSADGTVDVVTAQGRAVAGIPVVTGIALPVQLQQITASSLLPAQLFELIQK